MTSNDYLQRYIEIRGLSYQEISTKTGIGYHCVQKTCNGLRCNPRTQQAIAIHLGLDPERTWGRGSVVYLRRMVAKAANLAADEKAAQARSRFLDKYRDTDNLSAKRDVVNV